VKLTQEEYKKLKEDELISTNIWFLKEYLSELSPTKRVRKQQKRKQLGVQEIKKTIEIFDYLIDELKPPNDLLCHLMDFPYERLINKKRKLVGYLESIKKDKSRLSKNRERNDCFYTIVLQLKKIGLKQVRRIEFLFRLHYELNLDINIDGEIYRKEDFEQDQDLDYNLQSQLKRIDQNALKEI
tara:strand:- start:35 stop:586 length:552 start_codon:yes stop_codon:yes gene_type:complete